MMENIFAGGQQTRLSSLKNRFYTAIPIIQQDIKAALKNKGMYLLDPDSANGYSVGAAFVIVAPFLIAQFTGYKQVFNSVVLLIGCGIISAIIWWLFARQMSAKTVQGGRTRVAVLGFQEFMNRVDADRLKRMPPDTFEKYLPYAMALGVEHHWAQAFAGIIQNPPSWYVSPNGMTGFNPIFFSSSMHNMASDMHQVFVSAPRASSSGSGFGGAAAEDFRAADSAAEAEARFDDVPARAQSKAADLTRLANRASVRSDTQCSCETCIWARSGQNSAKALPPILSGKTQRGAQAGIAHAGLAVRPPGIGEEIVAGNADVSGIGGSQTLRPPGARRKSSPSRS